MQAQFKITISKRFSTTTTTSSSEDPKKPKTSSVPAQSDVSSALASYAEAESDQSGGARAFYTTVARQTPAKFSFLLIIVCACVYLAIEGFPDEWKVGVFFVVMLVLQRLVLRGRRASNFKDLRGKTVVITGGSSGIGQQTAAAMASMGATVIVSYRSGTEDECVDGIKHAMYKWKHVGKKLSSASSANSSSAANKLNSNASSSSSFPIHPDDAKIIAWPLTLENRYSVKAFAATLTKAQPSGVDIFINNAGSTPDMSELVVTKNEHEYHIDANFLGPYQLTEQLCHTNTIRETGAGTFTSSKSSSTHSGKLGGKKIDPKGTRIVYVVSYGHAYCHLPNASKNYLQVKFEPPKDEKDIGDERYHQIFQMNIAKFGNVCHSVVLGDRGYSACSVNPGQVASNLRRKLAPMIGSTLYWPAVWSFLRTPFEAAQVVVHAALLDNVTQAEMDSGDVVPTENPPNRNSPRVVFGGYYYNCRLLPRGRARMAGNPTESRDVCQWAALQTGTPMAGVVSRGGR